MKKSENMGGDTSEAEVLNISRHGFWLMVRDREHFLDFDRFPWFRRASGDDLCGVELLHEDHLYWPGLDVDLDLDRIEHPKKYPLVAGMGIDSEGGGRTIPTGSLTRNA
jgi:hypothetical protein